MTRILLTLIDFYRRWLSPALHSLGAGGCRFQPTCSEYAARAVAMHGPVKGTVLAIWRVLRCHPFSRGGLDQVPAVRGVPGQEKEPIRNARNENFSDDDRGTQTARQFSPGPDPSVPRTPRQATPPRTHSLPQEPLP